MDEFLESQRQQGSVESRGVFTLDFEASLRKMARFQTDEPALHLLKAVQLAHACQAQQITVRILQDELILTASPFESLPDLAARLRGEPAPPLPFPRQHRAYRHLVSCLAGCRQGNRVVQLLTHGGGREVRWKAGPDQPPAVFEGPSGKPSDFQLHVRIFGKAVELARHRTHLHATLARRCGFSPIPVQSDARFAELPGPERLSGQASSWLAERLELAAPGEEHFTLDCLGLRGGATYIQSCGRTWFGTSPSAMSLQELVSPVGLREPRRLPGAPAPPKEAATLRSTLTGLSCAGIKVLGVALLLPFMEGTGWTWQPGRKRAQPASSRMAYVSAFPRESLVLGSSYISHGEPYLAVGDTRWKIRRSLHIPASGSAPSQIFFVQDGVLLNPVPVALRPRGTVVLISDAELEVDAGGLEPVLRGHPVEELQELVNQTLLALRLAPERV